jgi:hypothetical protein
LFYSHDRKLVGHRPLQTPAFAFKSKIFRLLGWGNENAERVVARRKAGHQSFSPFRAGGRLARAGKQINVVGLRRCQPQLLWAAFSDSAGVLHFRHRHVFRAHHHCDTANKCVS